MAAAIRRGFEAMDADDEPGEIPVDPSAEERKTWSLVESLELRLRTVVRARYASRWGADAEVQIRKVLGEDAWSTIERNRDRHRQQYPQTPSTRSHDVLDYCYLPQLVQCMMAGPAWELFREFFRDKRQLEDLLKAVAPVRNDRAHFRTVPERELVRCQLACEDLMAMLAEVSG
jgi:hypothetical protein